MEGMVTKAGGRSKWCWYVSGGLLLALGVLEVWLRLADWWAPSFHQDDPSLSWRMRPGAALIWTGGRECVNPDGWRGPRAGDCPAYDPQRIAWIGASEALGLTVADESETAPRHLERVLREQYGWSDAAVLNFGVCAYTLFHGSILMNDVVPRIKPGFVVVSFTGWGLSRLVGWHDEAGHLAFVNSVWHRSMALRHLLLLTDPAVMQLRMSRKLRRLLGPELVKHRLTVESARGSLESIVLKAKAAGTVPVLLAFRAESTEQRERAAVYDRTGKDKRPDLPWEYYYAAQQVAYNAMVRDVARQAGAILVDLDSMQVETDDGAHPSARGCRLIAEHLAKAISDAISQRQSAGLQVGAKTGGAP